MLVISYRDEQGHRHDNLTDQEIRDILPAQEAQLVIFHRISMKQSPPKRSNRRTDRGVYGWSRQLSRIFGTTVGIRERHQLTDKCLSSARVIQNGSLSNWKLPCHRVLKIFPFLRRSVRISQWLSMFTIMKINDMYRRDLSGCRGRSERFLCKEEEMSGSLGRFEEEDQWDPWRKDSVCQPRPHAYSNILLLSLASHRLRCQPLSSWLKISTIVVFWEGLEASQSYHSFGYYRSV